MDKRGNAAKYPLRRRLSATSGSKIVSVYNGGGAVDFADREKKPRRWQEEEVVVVEGAERKKEASYAHRAGGSSPDVDTEEKIVASDMVDVSEGEEATRQPKRVAKIHNHGKALDDCNTVDPATVPRKLRSAMNKRNRESISPPLPESKKCNGSSGSRLTPMGYSNGIKKSRQSLKQANAMDRSPRTTVPIAVTKTEEEVAEALYDLSRMFTGSPVRSKTAETEIEETKPLPSPEERPNRLPLDSAAEDAKKREQEMVDASTDDVLRNPVDVKTSADPTTIIAQPRAAIPLPEKLDLESHVQLDPHNNTQFEKKSSALPLTDVSNVPVPPRGDSEKGLIQPPMSDLLPPDQAEKGPLQSEIFVVKRLEPSENLETCASLGSMPGVAPPLSSHNMNYGSYTDLDLSGLSSTKTTALGGSKSAVSTGKCPDSAKQTWKRCAIHVHLCHFIRCHQNDSKLPTWAVLSWQQPSRVNGDTQKTGTNSVYNHSISSSPTAHSTVERNPKSGCSQLIQGKIPAFDGVQSGETQGIDFLSLSPSASDGAKLRRLNSGAVESTLPAPSSFLSSVQHRSPFSIQPAQLHTGYTDQQLAATASQQMQVQFQVQLPQYIANPFLNPHFAATAATTPAGKQQQQQQQQLWVSQMAQYHQAAQFPKWSNGRNDVASLLPSSQPLSLLDPLSNTFAQSQQLFPLTSARNKNQQPPPQRQQIFRSEGPSQLQLLSNGDRK
ncbi:uncharacterized protein LOC116246874 isoform X1 [Nymphaea colorata]|nr:uncharacterized protein LOC116246874 isoform X1 [Nymphaea colorata]XP_031474636.1 uncharacterized protein LOC116246874 isoform X1 [Nymphaea colorata]XP_031474637.1 uncharacterized protein LOC116246874 isoform X1 [Nymphaea colorata]XP_031474638.1 uncharacterized protein LOC116246874 isoform X1 [Nymphaea colorata]